MGGVGKNEVIKLGIDQRREFRAETMFHFSLHTRRTLYVLAANLFSWYKWKRTETNDVIFHHTFANIEREFKGLQGRLWHLRFKNKDVRLSVLARVLCYDSQPLCMVQKKTLYVWCVSMPKNKTKCKNRCVDLLFPYGDLDHSINQVELNTAGFVLKQRQAMVLLSSCTLYKNLHFPIQVLSCRVPIQVLQHANIRPILGQYCSILDGRFNIKILYVQLHKPCFFFFFLRTPFKRSIDLNLPLSSGSHWSTR